MIFNGKVMSVAAEITIAEDQQSAYDKGVTDGKQAEHDNMWDGLQGCGNRTSYGGTYLTFHGSAFGFNNFYPKYDIKPVGDAARMFYAWSNGNTNVHFGDFKKRLNDCGIVLDTSKATNLSFAFSYNYADNLPVIDCTGITGNSTQVFSYSSIHRKTIEKVIVHEGITYQNWFLNCIGLANITFEGVIGQSIDLQWSTELSKVSITNIYDHLSTTASGMTLTLSKTAVNKAFGSTTADEWTALIATKPNWTISLV